MYISVYKCNFTWKISILKFLRDENNGSGHIQNRHVWLVSRSLTISDLYQEALQFFNYWEIISNSIWVLETLLMDQCFHHCKFFFFLWWCSKWTQNIFACGGGVTQVIALLVAKNKGKFIEKKKLRQKFVKLRKI